MLEHPGGAYSKTPSTADSSAGSRTDSSDRHPMIQMLRAKPYAVQARALKPGALVQRDGAKNPQSETEAVHQAAAHGIQSGGGSMPHLGAIQQSFGTHDVSTIQAHTGSAAKEANEAMGAEAYATGNHVAFKGTPDLHTAAHEAAHVVQQRSGVSLDGGVGAVGDSYEQHADKVADAVVSGQSAEGILNEMSGGASDVQQKAVQKAPPGGSAPGRPHGAPGSSHARTGATGETVGGETVPAPRPKTASQYKSLPGWTDFDALVSPLSSPAKSYQYWKMCIDQIDVNEQMWTKVGGDWTKTKTFIDKAGRGVFEQVASQLLPTAFDPTKTYGLFSGNLAKEYARSQVTILNDTAAGKIAEHLHASAPGKKWAFMQALWRAVSNVYAERVAFLNQGVNVYGRYEGDVFA